MNKSKYISPELSLKEVSKEDILNASAEATLDNELCLDCSILYF